MPCQSNTFARWPQLRSAACLFGKPNLLEHQQQLVDLGNQLVVFSVHYANVLYRAQAFFSIENPELVWLWLFQCVRELHGLPGVILTRFFFKQFGVPFVKPTLFLHNFPTMWKLAEVDNTWDGPTIVLRGQVQYAGQWQFKTHLAQPYPALLGLEYGKLNEEAVMQRQQELADGQVVSFADKSHDVGIPRQLLAAAGEWMHADEDLSLIHI